MNIPHAPAIQADLHLSDDAPNCPNCQATAPGNYCTACGEAMAVHRPSAWEFLHEFIGHFAAVEGKLLKTLRLLLLRPGELTTDFLRGRRIAYINPLRLYLTLSLVMFALIKMYGIELPRLKITENSFGITYTHAIPNPDQPDHPKTATLIVNWEKTGARQSGDNLRTWTKITLSIPDSLSESMDRLLALRPQWKANFAAFLREPPDRRSEILNHGFLANLPYMLIGAVPVFALYLKLIYLGSGRYYGEHLVFALHTNAYAFLLASLMIVIPGNAGWLALCLNLHLHPLIAFWDWVQVLPFLCLIAYLPIAMQRVYGGNWLATFCRWLLLISAHLSVILCLTVIAELIGIVGQVD